jgi:hypothetical protein
LETLKRRGLESLIIVLVDSNPTESCISNILLDGWASPASESSEITERRVTIVVCIPRREKLVEINGKDWICF